MAIAKIISLALLLWAARADGGVDTCEEDGGCEEVGLAQLRAIARRQAESGEGEANKEHTLAPARDAPIAEGEADAIDHIVCIPAGAGCTTDTDCYLHGPEGTTCNQMDG